MIYYDYGVALRALKEDDVKLIYDWRNDYRIWQWTRQNDLLKWQNHLNWFYELAKDPSIKMYGICLGPDADFLMGVCGLTSIEPVNQTAEFSLYVAPNHRKTGHGKAALKTLFNHGFKNLNLNCIWGETFEHNPAQYIFEKIGMKKEGVRRQFYFKEGKFIDCYLYSILRNEWR